MLANAPLLRHLFLFGERSLGVYTDIVDEMLKRLDPKCRVTILTEPTIDADGIPTYIMLDTTAEALSRMSDVYKPIEQTKVTHDAAVFELHRLGEVRPTPEEFDAGLDAASRTYKAFYNASEPIARTPQEQAALGFLKEMSRQALSREGQSTMQRILGAKRVRGTLDRTPDAGPPDEIYPVFRLPEPLSAPVVNRVPLPNIPSNTPIGSEVVRLEGMPAPMPPPLAFRKKPKVTTGSVAPKAAPSGQPKPQRRRPRSERLVESLENETTYAREFRQDLKKDICHACYIETGDETKHARTLTSRVGQPGYEGLGISVRPSGTNSAKLYLVRRRSCSPACVRWH
jgi:hypothetical protein